MRIRMLDNKCIYNLDYTFADRLVKSGKAEWVEGAVKSAPEPVQEVKIPEETKSEVVYKDNKGKKYTQEQVDKMDKRTGLYKEIMANKK